MASTSPPPTSRAFDDPNDLVTVERNHLRDLLADLAVNSAWTAENFEGVAITADGDLSVVTDNDGIDDATGETVFLGLGHWQTALTG